MLRIQIINRTALPDHLAVDAVRRLLQGGGDQMEIDGPEGALHLRRAPEDTKAGTVFYFSSA